MSSHKNARIFNEAYFERGADLGISLYRDYRWMPEVSLPMACELKAMYPKKRILDFGCAKGFLVKALRAVEVDAYGFDISDYAISSAGVEIRDYLFNDFLMVPSVDVVFAKDTLEHIAKDEIESTMRMLRKKCKQAFFIVPFGDIGVYRIQEYQNDLSHYIAENESWWTKIFKSCGFRLDAMTHRCTFFKDNWKNSPKGNGFFFLS